MAFKYVAYDNQGNVVEGSLSGASEALAKEALRQLGYDILSLKATRDRGSWRHQLPTLFKVRAPDVIMFSRLLATLVERGTNILVALQLIRDETTSPVFRELLDLVVEEVRHGRALSEALGQHPEAFSTMYCRMVKVGEQTGNLEAVLRQTADYLEKENALLSKVARALAYPSVVMLIAVGVITLLMTFVIPSFAGLFLEFETQIPLPTRILIGLSEFASQNRLYLLLGLLAAVLLAAGVVKHPVTRRRIDAALLSLPVLGPITRLAEMARFSRVVAMGLREGLPMPEVLEMGAGISRNRVVAQGVEQVRHDILEGRSLSQALLENPVFPQLLVQIARVGEEAANLENGLEAVAEAYETQVERRVTTLVAMIEPGIILFIGLMVAFIAVSVILPTYAILGEF